MIFYSRSFLYQLWAHMLSTCSVHWLYIGLEKENQSAVFYQCISLEITKRAIFSITKKTSVTLKITWRLKYISIWSSVSPSLAPSLALVPHLYIYLSWTLSLEPTQTTFPIGYIAAAHFRSNLSKKNLVTSSFHPGISVLPL